jgi:hypothetical protein
VKGEVKDEAADLGSSLADDVAEKAADLGSGITKGEAKDEAVDLGGKAAGQADDLAEGGIKTSKTPNAEGKEATEAAPGSTKTSEPSPTNPTGAADGYAGTATGPRIVENGIRVDPRTTSEGRIHSIKGDKLPDGSHSITIEGRLGPKLPSRAGFEKDVLLDKSGADKAHLWGRKFGDEAAAGIKYADPGFNRSWQQRVENTIENFAKSAQSNGNTAHLKATVVTQPHDPDSLAHVTYEFWETTPNGQFVDGWKTAIDHRGVVDTNLTGPLGSPPKPTIPAER